MNSFWISFGTIWKQIIALKLWRSEIRWTKLGNHLKQHSFLKTKWRVSSNQTCFGNHSKQHSFKPSLTVLVFNELLVNYLEQHASKMLFCFHAFQLYQFWNQTPVFHHSSKMIEVCAIVWNSFCFWTILKQHSSKNLSSIPSFWNWFLNHSSSNKI